MDMKAFSLEGKVALITGAAYGIGFAIAEAFAAAGAKICFNCRGEHHMEAAMKAYAEKGIDAHGYYCDVTKEEEVKEMVAKIEEEVGVIDILVNNAGIIKRIPGRRHRPERPLHRFKGRHPRHDQEGPRQDHQHLLHDVRAWP